MRFLPPPTASPVVLITAELVEPDREVEEIDEVKDVRVVRGTMEDEDVEEMRVVEDLREGVSTTATRVEVAGVSAIVSPLISTSCATDAIEAEVTA